MTDPTECITIFTSYPRSKIRIPLIGSYPPSISAKYLENFLPNHLKNLLPNDLVLLQLPPPANGIPNPRLDWMEPSDKRFHNVRKPVSDDGFCVGTINGGGLLALGANFRNSCFLLASQCKATGSDNIRGKPVADFHGGRCTRPSVSATTGLCKRCAEKAKKMSPECTPVNPLPDRKRRFSDTASRVDYGMPYNLQQPAALNELPAYESSEPPLASLAGVDSSVDALLDGVTVPPHCDLALPALDAPEMIICADVAPVPHFVGGTSSSDETILKMLDFQLFCDALFDDCKKDGEPRPKCARIDGQLSSAEACF